MNGLLLALCLGADPESMTLYEFEKTLDAAVPGLRFARYVTTPDRSRAVVLVWTGKKDDQLADGKLVLFRPNHGVRAIVLDDAGTKACGTFKPPPKPDVLLDEPLDSECGKWLKDLLDGLGSLREEGELHAFGAKWELLATKRDSGGQFRNRNMDGPAEYRTQTGHFEKFVQKASAMKPPALHPPEVARDYVFGGRGVAIRTSKDTILLCLEAPWDKLKVGNVRPDGYREVVLNDWFAEKIDENEIDFSELVLTMPKPKIDPLIPLIKP